MKLISKQTNMKAINKLIPAAIKEIDKSSIFENDSKVIPGEYKSYISSFGSSVIQSGLLPALAFNYAQSDTGKKRAKVMNIIFSVLKTDNKSYKDAVEENMLNYTLNNLSKERQIRKDIMNTAVAVKLAMRTFKFKKDDTN